MLLDTSGLLCFFDDKDFRHSDAATFIKTADFRLTTSYILAEFIPLCQTRGLNRKRTLEFAETLIKNPLIEIVWVDENLHHGGFTLLQNRINKNYSLCDAVSFIIYARARHKRSINN